MILRLAATGNPDFGQYGSIGVPTVYVEVASFAEASAKCLTFIRENNLGAGNWTGGALRASKGSKLLAKVSYNGKVWPPGDWKADVKPLWPEVKVGAA